MDIQNKIRSAIDFLRSGNMQQAERIFTEILEFNPENVTALHFTGVIHYQRKDYPSAIAYIKRALQLAPGYVDAYSNLGIVFQESGLIDEAIACYEKAIQLNPDFERAYYNLGTALREKWQLDEAIANYQKAIRINPHLVEAYNNLGLALQEQGRVNESEHYYREALRMKPDFAHCHDNLLLLMTYNPQHDPRAILSEHLRFANQFAEPLRGAVLPHTNSPKPDRRLRVGYVSPDFRRHSVNFFIEPVLAEHNHGQFEIYCYSDVVKPDIVTERLQGYADQWRNIAGMSDEEVSGIIRNDRIDILIDLAGHTANNRLLVFARKPSPVQITWIGYPPTSGLSAMDYKIVDSYTDPPGMTEHLYTEKLIRMPECFVCYLPDRESPPVGSLPVISSGHVTFGSFNNFAKVSPQVIALWTRILEAIPDSHLIMKWQSFADSGTRRYAIGMFTQRGISPERITLQSSEPPPKYLDSYNLVDIGLDTFPFNGLTTTCEALWMGVPVITLTGASYASGVGVSILSNIGMPDLVAKTYDEYVKTAVTLAADTDRLQSLRNNLRETILQSSLMNGKRFIFDVEKYYRQMWERWCESAKIIP